MNSLASKVEERVSLNKIAAPCYRLQPCDSDDHGLLGQRESTIAT